jgi:hypothetical protein
MNMPTINAVAEKIPERNGTDCLLLTSLNVMFIDISI